MEGLPRLRKKASLSQFGLGLRLQPPVTPVTVSRWERGESLPTRLHLAQLTAALGCTTADLFTDDTAANQSA